MRGGLYGMNMDYVRFSNHGDEGRKEERVGKLCRVSLPILDANFDHSTTFYKFSQIR